MSWAVSPRFAPHFPVNTFRPFLSRCYGAALLCVMCSDMEPPEVSFFCNMMKGHEGNMHFNPDMLLLLGCDMPELQNMHSNMTWCDQTEHSMYMTNSHDFIGENNSIFLHYYHAAKNSNLIFEYDALEEDTNNLELQRPPDMAARDGVQQRRQPLSGDILQDDLLSIL